MSATLYSTNFGDKLYYSLPEVYRDNDINVNYALKRYLQGLSDGGFAYVIDEANGILKLVDPSQIDADLLYILFKQYGLEIFNGIPEIYLRNLLLAISSLYTRKGSITSVEFLTSVIAGVVVHVDYSLYESEGIVRIVLEMDYEAQGREGTPSLDQLKRILKEFLPFYIDAELIFSYIFVDEINLHVEEDMPSDSINVNYIEEINFDMTGNLSLLDKQEARLSLEDRLKQPKTFQFITSDRGEEDNPTAADYTVDSISLNDGQLYDNIYRRGRLVETRSYEED